MADADTDAALAQTLADTRRVLVPYFFVFEHEVRPLDDEGQRLLNRSRVVGFTSADAEQAIQRVVGAEARRRSGLTRRGGAGRGRRGVRPRGD